eukprot:TRINITY_DN12475_c0_g6_i2.p1 TRINITY_DN12475_c0_g6~~TRINITY_DN12475_c0_g6_i2.p1  ORF type:complete len:607 (+),score=173.16 TRINITY_DN12475_c0_g6_i2:87-1907(+)
MYVNVVYPSHEEVEIRVEQFATFAELGYLIATKGPVDSQNDKFLKKHSAFVVRASNDVEIDLFSQEPVVKVLKGDDIIDIRPGVPSAVMKERPHAVQIVDFQRVDENSNFILNEDAIDQVLGGARVRNLPVAVVSISGPFRTGKSFMLNFFLRYLQDEENWSVQEGDTVESLFHWKHGVTRDTTGIWLWNQPFIRTLPDGRKVALLLVDTQGTFDNKATMNENTRIFALNALISSKQIYNIKEKISEDILQQMHLFTEFGTVVAKKLSDQKPFQILEFLIRDWEFDDHPHGAQGGKDYLNNVLAVHEDTPKQLAEVREWLRECYEDIGCFLLPDPGKKVKKPEFQGQLSVLEDDFREMVAEYVPHVLKPEALVLKTVAGETVTCQGLAGYIKAYVQAFNGEELPVVQTILEATAKVNQDNVRQQALSLYDDSMRDIAGPGKPYIEAEMLAKAHRKHRKAALELFDAAQLLGSKTTKERTREGIQEAIETQYKQLQGYNASKDILRGLRTPFAFAVLAFLLHIVSVVLDVVELDSIAYLLSYVAMVSALVVGVWAALNYSGEYPGIIENLNSMGDNLWEYGKGAVQTYLERSANGPPSGALKRKKTQ